VSRPQQPHIVIARGKHPGRARRGEFVTQVAGVGTVTVLPGRDARWEQVLHELRRLAPKGTARNHHYGRVLYYADRVAGPGAYPAGATLQWGRP
jgi:hypothetical protein